MMNDDNVVKIEGSCQIQTARERQVQLINAFRSDGDVKLDCALTQDVDLTFVQQLVSATKTANAAGKCLRLVAVSDSLRSALARAGVGFSSADNSITTP